jgi:type VI protein secretion system component VasF
MPSPELLAPERAERLLAGAPPETAREADVERLVRELRALSAPAPAELRERVAGLSLPRAPRRPRLVVALAAAAILVASVSAAALLRRDEQPARETAPTASAQAAGTSTTWSSAPRPTAGGANEEQKQSYRGAIGPTVLQKDGATTTGGAGVATDASRAQDVDLSLALRVKDADAVSDAAADALAVTRDLGGVVAASNVDTSGREGRAQLELSVPTRRLDDAIARLSALGTITEQRVGTRDLQGGIDRRGRAIERLRAAIRADELRLASGTLDAGEKLEVELRLLRERARLRDLTRARTRLLREAAYAEVTLTLHTREASAPPAKGGGVSGAARDAVDALGRAAEIAVFAAILLAPLAVLVFVMWVGLRSRRRRADERLLERPSPAARS